MTDSTDRQSTPARRFQVSLLGLFAVVLLCGMVLAYLVARSKGTRLAPTGRDLDVAIVGRGYFAVTSPDSGEVLYTRQGRMRTDAGGCLVIDAGQGAARLEPEIVLPGNVTDVSIRPDGEVSVAVGDNPTYATVGAVQLTTFSNPEGLRLEDNGFYAGTEQSEIPFISSPGMYGAGLIQQGWLEESGSDTLHRMSEMAVVLFMAFTVVSLLLILVEQRRQGRQLRELTERSADQALSEKQ